jgi:hypothetical protein
MDVVDLLGHQAPFPSTEVAAGKGKAQGIGRICGAQPRRRLNQTWRFTADQAESYRRDGFTVSPFRLPDALLDKMRDALERLLDNAGGIPPERLICPHILFGAKHDAQCG